MRNNITNENKIFQESIEFEELTELKAKQNKPIKLVRLMANVN